MTATHPVQIRRLKIALHHMAQKDLLTYAEFQYSLVVSLNSRRQRAKNVEERYMDHTIVLAQYGIGQALKVPQWVTDELDKQEPPSGE